MTNDRLTEIENALKDPGVGRLVGWTYVAADELCREVRRLQEQYRKLQFIHGLVCDRAWEIKRENAALRELGAERAEAMEAVEARIEKMHEALSEIATQLPDDPRHAMRIARAALDGIACGESATNQT